jgi:flagellar hook-length control protein FliK
MQVFALLGSVTPAPTVSQGQVALTDYSEGQQQSYSKDVATLLATMDTSLEQLDHELQQLAAEPGPAEPAQDLVQSMLAQPLSFDPTVPTAVVFPETTATELTEQLNAAASSVLSVARPLAEQKTEFSALPAAAVQPGTWSAASINLQPALQLTAPLVAAPQQTLPELKAAALMVQSQPLASTDWNSDFSAAQPDMAARLNPMLALAPSKMLNLSTTLTTQQSMAITETAVPSAAVTPAYGATASTLPQWQADPLPAQSQHFGQRLMQMLADKVDLQLGLNVNKAMIRLDPPSLGSIELSVQLDGDRLTVQMHSSNTQLRDAMAQGLEQLRASLQQKLGAELQIELRMGSDSSSQQQQQKTPLQLAQPAESNFHSEPEQTLSEAKQLNKLNLVNQLV